jgi:UDP-GlcNAc:undecaprenyl-phosphate GlcNAc-1-phosphate transferase
MGPSAVFRIQSGQDLLLTVSLHQSLDSTIAADIAFRFLQRLSLAIAERIEGLLTVEESGGGAGEEDTTVPPARPDPPGPRRVAGATASQAARALVLTSTPSLSRIALSWLRIALGWEARPVAHHPSLGDE